MATETGYRLKIIFCNFLKYLLYSLGIIVTLIIITPLLVLLPCSLNSSHLLEWPKGTLTLSWYKEFLFNSEWNKAFFTSLIMAGIVAFLSTLLGAGSACSISETRGAKNLHGNMFFLSPLAMPVIAFALAVYICLIKVGLTDSLLGLIGSHCILFIPISYALTHASLKKRQPFLEQAALNLGASKFKAWLYVTLPSIKKTLVASILLIFIMSFNEVVVSVFLTDTKVKTVSKQLWNGVRYEISPIVATASIFTILVVVPVIIVIYVLFRRVFGESKYA